MVSVQSFQLVSIICYIKNNLFITYHLKHALNIKYETYHLHITAPTHLTISEMSDPETAQQQELTYVPPVLSKHVSDATMPR